MNARAIVTAWFLERSSRERWLLSVMAALFVLLVAWLAIHRPLMSAIDAAKARHVVAVRQHGLVMAQLAQLDSGRRPTVGTGGRSPLALRITEAAARSGVALSSNEPRGPGRVAITMTVAAPTATLRWLRQLEQSGIVVSELAMTRQGPSSVVVRATLADGGNQ